MEIEKGFYVYVGGKHFCDYRIYTEEKVIKDKEKLDEINKKRKESFKKDGESDELGEWRYSMYSPLEFKLVTPDRAKIFNWSTNRIGPFKSLYEAKYFCFKRRLMYIDNNLITIKNDIGIDDPEINELIKKKLGYYKVIKAIERLKEVYPEYQV
jgi:hypothetical protein